MNAPRRDQWVRREPDPMEVFTPVHNTRAGEDYIAVDLIDRAGTRYRFAAVAPAGAWPAIAELVLEGARAEAAKMHGTVQAYWNDDPERALPEADDETQRETADRLGWTADGQVE